MTTHDDDEIMLILSQVERLVGSFANGQREKTISAIRDNPDGVLALATRLAANPTVKNTVAVFVTSIDRGEHRLHAAPTPPPPTAARRVHSTTPPPLTLEQVERNRRIAVLARRTNALRATDAVRQAVGNLTGFAALDAAEACLDQLEAEPDPVHP